MREYFPGEMSTREKQSKLAEILIQLDENSTDEEFTEIVTDAVIEIQNDEVLIELAKNTILNLETSEVVNELIDDDRTDELAQEIDSLRGYYVLEADNIQDEITIEEFIENNIRKF